MATSHRIAQAHSHSLEVKRADFARGWRLAVVAQRIVRIPVPHNTVTFTLGNPRNNEANADKPPGSYDSASRTLSGCHGI